MKNDFFSLVLAQLSAPAARIVFALFLVPIHPHGTDVILVMALAELLSTFLTFGRSYLLQSGFSHHLTTAWLDKLLLITLTTAGYFLLATDEQEGLIAGIAVMTCAITSMTMCNAYFLKTRKLAYILPLNLFIYLLATFSTFFSLSHALIAMISWLVIEKLIPSPDVITGKRILPVAATLLAFATQRIDVQISARVGDPSFLEEIFQLSALFMPLALIVRLVGNTALLRGRAVINGTLLLKLILSTLGLLYGLFLYGAGLALSNTTIVNNVEVLTLTTVLSALTITYRESIAIQSRRGEFFHLLGFSVVGFLPSVVYLLFVGSSESVNSMGFVIALYLAPRVLMFVYGSAVFGRRDG